MTEEEALGYLAAAGRFGELGLGRTEELLANLGHPERAMRFYHVAGTNGKGSVTAALARMLEACGRRAGRFTSPHLERPHERIAVSGRDIDPAGLVAATELVRRAASPLADPPTEFELWTGVALMHFLAEGVTDVAWETGLGGRYDSTNVVQPEVSIVSSIGMDHMDRLGDTLAKIAWEKAGILKPGVPAVVGDLPPEAMAVIERTAAELEAPLWRLGREIAIDRVAVDALGTTFDYRDPLGPAGTLRFGLIGAHQAANGALAFAALRASLGEGQTAQAAAALQDVRWPGRFEVVRQEPPLVLDGAHNPQGTQALADTWRSVYGERRPIAVFGCLADRDAREVTRPMLGLVAHWHTAAPESPRRLPAEDAAEVVGGTPHESPPAALKAALRQARAEGRPVLCFGSLYLIGELRGILRREGFIAS